MASPVESGDNPKPRPALSELITTAPIILHKKASSRSSEKHGMDSAANGDVIVYKLYKRRWLGLGEHTSQGSYQAQANGYIQREW